jgi:hypothetical protein
MLGRFILLLLLVLVLTSCRAAPPPTPIEANAPAVPEASVTDEDLLGIWVGTQGQPYLRFTEDGRYCLALFREELDAFPGDCGTFKVEDMVLTFVSDQGYCKGETGTYDLALTTLGRLQMKVSSDDCHERNSNVNNTKFGLE